MEEEAQELETVLDSNLENVGFQEHSTVENLSTRPPQASILQDNIEFILDEDSDDNEIETENTESTEEYPEHLDPIIKENTTRFQSAKWFEKVKTLSIAIIGCGGIGSYTGFLVSRLHPANIALFDFDRVDATNLGGQLFNTLSVGQLKNESLRQFIRSYSAYYNIQSYPRFTSDSDISSYDIIIGALDNMETRKLVFKKWKNQSNPNTILIDGRLNAEEFQIFTLSHGNPELVADYEKEWLFTSEEAMSEICSYKQTSFMANMIGTMINNIIVNHAYNLYFMKPIRTIPYKMYYSGPSMDFKIE